MTEDGGDPTVDQPMRTDKDSHSADATPPEGQDAAELAPLPHLSEMVVLPPRQKEETTAGGAASFVLPLPQIRPEEPVQSIRMALGEVVGLAHLTKYRIEVIPETTLTDGKNDFSEIPLVSPFTGPNAIVSIPAAMHSLNEANSISHLAEQIQTKSNVLDDFGDLQSNPAIQDRAALQLVLERYDAASVKEHIARLRHLFDGNAPSVTSLLDDNTAESASEDDESKVAKEENGRPKPLPGLPSLTSPRLDGKNLKNFFYSCAGEEASGFLDSKPASQTMNQGSKSKKKKGKAVDKKLESPASEKNGVGTLPPAIVTQKILRLNQLESAVQVACTVQYSGYHPPPSMRRMVGDIAYLEVEFEGQVLFVTATTVGFIINRSNKATFDPSPASNHCFSHSLLDCLLQASDKFVALWSKSLEAAKERSEILSQINKGPFATLFRVAIRGDIGGFQDPSVSMKPSIALDGTLNTPSWLVSLPKEVENEANGWNQNKLHRYQLSRAEDDISQTFGVDVRNGALRDWNEELQLAREMPVSTIIERVERARVIHKTMTEFGEAALVGVKAICDGHIAPMNPNEGSRTQVYLHNNIFVSRALDVGPETFRLVKGDKAAKKSASREIQCIKTFHRMENSGFHTLATVLVDYLGCRFICQSILPGILQGEKSHTILLGSVDVEIPMKSDGNFQALLREKIAEPLNLVSRPVFTSPLTDERSEECKRMKKASMMLAGFGGEKNGESEVDKEQTMDTCAPLETKGIKGSDQRMYLLDFGRMTPRDANWVPKEKGGTGKWEEMKGQGAVPSSIEDEEWTMNVLRPELVSQWIRSAVSKYIEQRRKEFAEKLAAKRAEKEKLSDKEKASSVEEEEKFSVSEEEQRTITDMLRLNVNVFLPDVRIVAEEEMKADEDKAREAAAFLWDEILPRITRAIRERGLSQLPIDGKALTEFLHRSGVNCRYLGRLAALAQEEEEKDAKINKQLKDIKDNRVPQEFTRRTMPLGWLELLECEMVARAGKHVLDFYMVEKSGAAAAQPAQTIASFLSAIVSEREETATQTEARLEKHRADPDEEAIQALSVFDVGGDGDALPSPNRSRSEIWEDIESEIGRRFRYNLRIFNRGNKSGRAIHVPLLRRVCQRTGIRLVAKDYKVGATCYTEGNASRGRLTATFPVSPVDIADIVPMMKHSAAYYEGFAPCSIGPTLVTPPLQISLYDAKVALERAHLQMQARGLPKALELAQEAATLYQRVTENGAHPGVVECVELMSNVFLEANDPVLATANCEKALGLAVQSGGFDGPGVFQAHVLMFQMLFTTREFEQCVKHLRAAMYILDISGGPRHVEHYDALHKLGAVYGYEEYKGRYCLEAVNIFKELEQLIPNDRLLEGFTLRALAKNLAQCGDYRDAVEAEKRANKCLSRFVSSEHAAMKESDSDLKKYLELSIKAGKDSVSSKTKLEQEQLAEAMAADLVAEVEQEDLRKKHKNGKKKGKN